MRKVLQRHSRHQKDMSPRRDGNVRTTTGMGELRSAVRRRMCPASLIPPSIAKFLPPSKSSVDIFFA